MSVVPPGGPGIRNEIGRLGNLSWADIGKAIIKKIHNINNATVPNFLAMDSPLLARLWAPAFAKVMAYCFFFSRPTI